MDLPVEIVLEYKLYVLFGSLLMGALLLQLSKDQEGRVSHQQSFLVQADGKP